MTTRSLALSALVALAATGCVVDHGPPPPPPIALGTLTVDWTINGTKDPAQCNQAQAVAIQITITTANGGFAGVYQQQCQVFATSITLAEGPYTAQAELIDPNGQPRTTSVPIPPFQVIGGAEIFEPIDFPANSFF